MTTATNVHSLPNTQQFRQLPTVLTHYERKKITTALDESREYIPAMARTLLAYTTNPRQNMNPADVAIIHEIVTRANFLSLIFHEIVTTFGEHIPQQYMFKERMDKVKNLTYPYVSETVMTTSLSISACVTVNHLLHEMIEDYYTPVRRSFWSRLFG